jgi:hypothetical protein
MGLAWGTRGYRRSNLCCGSAARVTVGVLPTKVAATAKTLSAAEVARGESVDCLVVTLAATLHDG